MKRLNYFVLITGLLIACLHRAQGQTSLYPGDLAVVGISINPDSCSNGGSGADFISFVCLKTIHRGTSIDLTDNGWERQNPGLFGNSEGALRMERNGPSIPAGTLITLRTDPASGNPEITAPDSDWIITSLSKPDQQLDLDSNGDQLIFLQGGTWSNGTESSPGNYNHDASYEGGRLLYAFNSQDHWTALQDSPHESALPPGLQACQSLKADSGTADFWAYNGPTATATPIIWAERLSAASNWQSYAACSSYPGPPASLAVEEYTIGIDCQECSACTPYQETMVFQLPATGGPFDLIYLVNEDSVALSGVAHNDTRDLAISENTSVKLQTLTSAAGCTFTPPTSNGFEALIEPMGLTYTFEGTPCDTSCYSIDFTFEGNGPFLLNYYFSHQDSSQSRTLISLTNRRSLDICPADFPEQQEPVALILTSLKDLNCEIPLNDSLLVAQGSPAVFNLSETLCAGDSRIINGTTYDEQNPSGQEIIPGAAANGCDSIINLDFQFVPSPNGSLLGDASICTGQSTHLTLQLPENNQFAVEIQDDQGGVLFLANALNGSTLEVTPDQTTTYTLVSISPNNTACTQPSDQSVTVAVSDLELDLRPESDYNGYPLSCPTASDGALSVHTQGGTAPFSINWNTGATTAELQGLAAGSYTVSVQDDTGCRQTETITLNAPAAIRLTRTEDPGNCASTANLQIADITGGVAPYTYSIDGQFFTRIDALPYSSPVLAAGNYELIIQDQNNCQLRQPVTIKSSEDRALNLGPDITIASGDSTLIEVIPPDLSVQATWINTETATFLSEYQLRVAPALTQTYGLRLVYPDGCVVEDYLTVFVTKTSNYYAPTAFSPDEDGHNDYFRIYGGPQVRQISRLRIFNRWGQLLYEQENLSADGPFEGWDGNYLNQPAASGTYLFSAALEYQDGRQEIVNGTFVLLR